MKHIHIRIDPAIDLYDARKALWQMAFEYYRDIFIADHDITADEFNEDHWQTMFALTYPEVTL